MENAVAHRLRLSGVVQGVGMRPWLYRLAQECGLTGWVSNDGHGVELLLCGPASAIAACRQRLDEEAPPPASIDGITELPPPPPPWPTDFRILPTPSATGGQRTQRTISPPDLAPCPDCLADFSDPTNRRWRHPFLSCTQCGPRYTVVRALPYDRCRTSLADFPLCPACAGEYRNPADRRFHAEPLCCPACGPQLWLRDRQGHLLTGEPLPSVLSCLQTGGIVALKGVGGWQLLCDARNPAAVANLRQRKGRDAKPFALLAANLASLAGVVTVDTAAGDLLTTAARPIVLLPSVTDALTGVAPGLDRLGVMLPASPLHYLLFHEAAGQPSGSAWLTAPQELLLVATSANLSGEPLLIDDPQALAELPAIADLLLGHDRPIVTRCDDSLLLPPDPAHPQPTFIRRARGYAPLGIRLPLLADHPPTAPVILAVGGHFKNTVCVLRGDTAYLSQHLGDLDNAAACRAFEASTRHLLQLLDVTPAVIAHDLHPDFHSSRFAVALAAELGVPTIAVPHHQAHLAAVLAEHGLSRGYGLALDGVGLGPDGSLWGGELLHLHADGSCQRLGHLRPLPLPGGDRAAREPWRLAAAALHLLGRGDEIPQRFADQPAAATVAQMLTRQLNCPPTTSLGRLFDAAAGLLGVCPVQQYEAQAAMQLEALARRCPDAPPLTAGWRLNDGQLDFLPLLAWLAEAPRDDLPYAAATFHATLAAGLASWVVATVPAAAPLAIGGGCALNRTLTAALQQHLSAKGRPLLSARQAPPNDGGIALGQAILAAAAR